MLLRDICQHLSCNVKQKENPLCSQHDAVPMCDHMLCPFIAQNLSTLEINFSVDIKFVIHFGRAGNDAEIIDRSKDKEPVTTASTKDFDLAESLSVSASQEENRHINQIEAYFQISGRL